MAISFELIRELFNTALKYPQKIAITLDHQAWTYAELIEQIMHVADYLYQINIVQGQIIYQFVERSFEMVCGLFGILCAGGIYCPIDPADPPERVVSILQQLQGQYALVHWKTYNRFPSITTIKQLILLDKILISSSTIENINNIPEYRECDAALIMCTSGTTGKQKAVVHTFKSISTSVFGLIRWNLGLYTFQQQILQVAASSWILHVLEIMTPLVIGGTVVLLRPSGHLDMNYFCQTMIQQQVTTLTIGPAIIRALTNYLEITQRIETFQFVRNLCTVGEAVKPKQLAKLIETSQKFNIQISNKYGLTECNAALGCRLKNIDDCFVPMGYPIPGCECLLIDEKGKIISNTNNSNEIGQIHLGGSGLFHCYLNDPERTSNMFVTIQNKIYMKTGDLARYNIRGELVPAGRIDFQIKIRGQRVETAEIENTIIEWSPNEILNCLVTKIPEDEDLLIAYVVSKNLDLPIEEIREYCNKKLRQYMVPPYFILLDKFPLNANGKIDRKGLPLPKISNNAPTAATNFFVTEDQTKSDLEKKIYNLWCSTLRLDTVPRERNCFALGGSSLTLMQFFNYYQFHLAPNKELNIEHFFTNPTISNHVRLLINSETETSAAWTPLHLRQVERQEGECGGKAGLFVSFLRHSIV